MNKILNIVVALLKIILMVGFFSLCVAAWYVVVIIFIVVWLVYWIICRKYAARIRFGQ